MSSVLVVPNSPIHTADEQHCSNDHYLCVSMQDTGPMQHLFNNKRSALKSIEVWVIIQRHFINYPLKIFQYWELVNQQVIQEPPDPVQCVLAEVVKSILSSKARIHDQIGQR